MKKQTFEEWLAKVNAIIKERTGLHYSDLPDQPYADWYADGVTPRGAASRAIRNAQDE